MRKTYNVSAKPITMNSEYRFSDYLLLNSSFNNHIGVCNGKASVILYFYLAPFKLDVWKHNVAFSLMEEALSQISIYSPLYYGNGIAGVGVLLELLSQNGLIEEDTNELLGECEQYLFNSVFYSKVDDISIAKGIAGIGTYFLHRLNSINKAPIIQHMRFTESVIACVDQVYRFLFKQKEHRNNALGIDISIFTGYSGVLLFISRVYHFKCYEYRTIELLDEIGKIVLNQLNNNKFSWEKAEGWFIFFYIQKTVKNFSPHENILNTYHLYVSEAMRNLDSIFFTQCAFTALWFKLIYLLVKSEGSLMLSNAILDKTDTILTKHHLGELFPFDKESHSVNMGLLAGVTGTALPLLSLATEDYKWLNILGINIDVDEYQD